MYVNLISTHPKVRQNNGKLAVQRGPIIYCMEETDIGKDLHNISINTNGLRPAKSTLKSYKFVTIKLFSTRYSFTSSLILLSSSTTKI